MEGWESDEDVVKRS
jgi:hypothetical protein